MKFPVFSQLAGNLGQRRNRTLADGPISLRGYHSKAAKTALSPFIFFDVAPLIRCPPRRALASAGEIR
jgi:hypothetical protein